MSASSQLCSLRDKGFTSGRTRVSNSIHYEQLLWFSEPSAPWEDGCMKKLGASDRVTGVF